MISRKKSNRGIIRTTLRLVVLAMTAVIIQSSRPKFTTSQTNLKSYRILFSEWNFGATDREKQFIELSSYCFKEPGQKSRVNMNRFKVAIIDPGGSVVVVCHKDVTKEFTTRTTWYFVIGGSEINTKDMELSSCEIPTFFTENHLNYIPTGKNIPYAMVLLYNQRVEQLNFVELAREHGRLTPKQLTQNEIKKLKSNIQDIYIFGSMTQFGNCELFQELLNDASHASVIVRDWQAIDDMEDFSVNRCSQSTEPYQRSSLVFTFPTPGKMNECDNSFKFSIDDILPAVTDPIRVTIGTSGLYRHCFQYHTDVNADNNGITSREYFNVKQQAARMEISDHDPYIEPMDIDPIIIDQDVAAKVLVENITATLFDIDASKISNVGAERFIWDDCSPFPPSWTATLQHDPDNPLNIGDILNNETCYWYEYLNTTKKGRCKLCHALLEQNIIFEKQHKLPDIVSEGYLYRRGKNRKNINRKAIKNHRNSHLHRMSIQYFSAYDEGKRGETLREELLKKGGEFRNFFEPTENLLVVAYQAVRMGLSFYNFPKLLEMLRFFGINTGHVHNDDQGMRKVVMFIESMIRKDIINFLKKERPELGIMLDSSTDVSGSNALAVLFVSFIENRPSTFFYKLFPVEEGTSGSQLFQAFKREIEADDLGDYVKDRLTSYITDGCGTMTSTFYGELKKYVRTNFNQHWCYAHQLNLVSKNAFKNFEFFKIIDNKLNSLASFYGTIATSRRRVLHQVTLRHGQQKFELKRMQEIRWIASKTRVIGTFLSRWRVVTEATEKISKDKSFDRETRNSAQQHYNVITDGTFLATAAFVFDTCELLAGLSEHLQVRGGTLIGKRLLLDGLKSNLLSMNEHYGQKLSWFLQNSITSNSNESSLLIGPSNRAGVSLSDFEANSVSLYGIVLNQHKQYFANTSLQHHLSSYLESIADQLDHYFGSNNAWSSFDFLDARLFWSELGNEHYGVEEVLTMNAHYSWDYENETLVLDWKSLLNGLKLHSDFEDRHTDNPEEFWTFYLGLPDEDIGWTDITRSFIRRVMNIMASTAEVERIFSLYSAQKTRRRYNLKVETVNALVSIKFNTVSNLNGFPAFRYAREFIKLYDRADDLWRKDKININTTQSLWKPFEDPSYGLL